MQKIRSTDTILTALSTQKMSQEKAFKQYDSEMLRNAHSKSKIIIESLPNLNNEDVIVDLGCCNGELTNRIAKVNAQCMILGIDLSIEFLKIARIKNIRLKNVRFIKADANCLPKNIKNIKVFILSSLFHEIYSYGESRGKLFSKITTIKFLNKLKKRLKNNGVIIIKDPAKPEKPNEEIFFSIAKTEGLTALNYEKSIKNPVQKLNINSRYIRFLYDFQPLKENHFLQKKLLNQINNKFFPRYIAPAWIISEFIRHRNLCATDGNWNSEMKEQYGVFTVQEFTNIANKLNFNIIELVSYYNPSNHSVINNNEITFWNKNGIQIKRKDRFPTNLTVVLEKKYE